MTMAAESTMPPLDMSAALQAAVAAAAEIARVGFPDGTETLFPSTPAPAAETASPPALDNESPSPAPPAAAPQPELIQFPRPVLPLALDNEAPSPAPPAAATAPQPQLVQFPRPVFPEIRPAESTSPASFTSSQCTGQDAAGDKLQASTHNDMPPLTGGTDAAGEKTFEEESEEDAAKRLARSRERNREHARRTRLRKKAQLEALQSRVRDLEAEKKALKQKIEECSIASILINLADTSQDEPQPPADATTNLLDATIQKQENSKTTDAKIHLLTAGKRKRFASVDNSEENKTPQALKLRIDGQTRIIGPKSHINWKTGVYSDEDGVQRQLTSEQLESLRRERNRMHAKMTRDRKKNFIATIEKTIEELERDCQKMRDVLNKVGAHEQAMQGKGQQPVAQQPPVIQQQPAAPPQVAPAPSLFSSPAGSLLSAAAAIAPAPGETKAELPVESPPKRAKVAHGFSWNG